ncbi:hypothetical protein ACJX0J_010793, partial [Zea mays]
TYPIEYSICNRFLYLFFLLCYYNNVLLYIITLRFFRSLKNFRATHLWWQLDLPVHVVHRIVSASLLGEMQFIMWVPPILVTCFQPFLLMHSPGWSSGQPAGGDWMKMKDERIAGTHFFGAGDKEANRRGGRVIAIQTRAGDGKFDQMQLTSLSRNTTIGWIIECEKQHNKLHCIVCMH